MQIWGNVLGNLCLQNCLSTFQYLPLGDVSCPAVQIVFTWLSSYGNLLENLHSGEQVFLS